MARHSVDQQVQLGVETTEQTAVSCNRRLSVLRFMLNPRVEVETGNADGYKNDTYTVPTVKYTDISYEGPACYNHSIYPLGGLVGSGAPVQIGATAGYTWTITPSITGRDTNRKTYTIEKGDSVAAMKAAGMVFTTMNLEVTRTSQARMTGAAFAAYASDGNTLTASPTVIAARPIEPGQWDIYVNDTFGAIGTTKVASCYRASFGFGDPKYTRFNVLNTGYSSHKESVERFHGLNFSFSTDHDAQSRALYADASSTSGARKKYVRFKAVGQNIGASADELFQIDTVGEFTTDTTPDADFEGVFGYNFTFRAIYDASLGGSWKYSGVNRLTGY